MAVFFDELIDISLGATGAWTDIDLSASCPAGTTLVAILVQQTNASEQAVGLRCEGSTDNRTPDMNQGQAMFFIGCDEDRIVEGYIESADVDYYLAGYWTTDAVARVNGRDLSLGSGGSGYVDITNNYSQAGNIAVYEVSGGRGQKFLLRCNGSTDTRYLATGGFVGAMAGTDENNTTEGAIASTDIDFFGVAYIKLAEWEVNRTEKSATSTGSYDTFDLSLDFSLTSGVTAICLEVANYSETTYAIREYDSTDDYYYTGPRLAYYATGTSDDDKIQEKVGSTTCDMFKVAYFSQPSWDVAVVESCTITDAVVVALLLNVVSETFSVTDDLDPVEVNAAVAEAIALSESGSFRKSLLTINVPMTGGGCEDVITVSIPV